MSEHKYYRIDSKYGGKQTFAKVSDAKRYLYLNWDMLANGRDSYCVTVYRNLLEHATYTKIGNKLVRIN